VVSRVQSLQIVKINQPENEQKLLQENCWLIRSRVVEIYGRNNGSYKLIIKSEVTQYLQAVGTPAAMQLLRAYEAEGFQSLF
jgi:hypothetical protein